jgi:hypothetical protein
MAKVGLARAVAMGVLAFASACASRDEGEDDINRVDQVRRGVVDAAASPFRDIGLVRPEVPRTLQSLKYPYSQTNLTLGCDQVLYEIGQLDAILGAESFQPGAERGISSKGLDAIEGAVLNAARDSAGDIIPYRGWVRRISGAAKAEKEASLAIVQGQTRRAYLRGYGAALGCLNAVPAPPPVTTPQPVDPRTPPPAARDVRDGQRPR